jgi:putative membrane protein
VITGFGLATLNALFNTSAALLMLLGYRAIRRKERERHRRFMLGAFTASCLFLASYLTRMTVFGEKHFGGEGALRVVYLGILISHVILALAVAPMVLTSLWLGLSKRLVTHKKLARVTLPLWAYVSVTGVIVYFLLYHGPG